jgi:hypothetical protein
VSGRRRALLILAVLVGVVNFSVGAAAETFYDACVGGGVGLSRSDCGCFAVRVTGTDDFNALLAYFRASREIHAKGAAQPSAEAERQMQPGIGLVGKYMLQCHR